MKSSFFSEIVNKDRHYGNRGRWASVILAAVLSAAAAAALPGAAVPNSRVLAAAGQQGVISTGTPTSGNAVPTAGQPSAAELERLQGFANTLEQQGISSSPQRRTGTTVSGGYISTGTPTVSSSQGTVTGTGQGPVVVQGTSDPRLEGMSSVIQSWEAEHGPAVQDVVIQTRRPWQEADSEYQLYDPAGNLQYQQLDESILASEWESAGLVSGYPSDGTQGAVQNNDSFTGGYNLFPTTDWRQFGTELVSLGTFTLTAYDPCLACCGKTDGITATGSRGMAGRTIAVDPEVIPYGSMVVVGGYVFIAEDSGEAIKGNHIDLFMDTHEVAKQFGVREAEVWLIR